MISIWIFVIFFAMFAGVLIWERWDYNKLLDNTRALEHFLDLYISQYGAKFGIIVEDTREDIDVDTK